MKIGGFISYAHEDGSELTTDLANYLTNLIPSFEAVYDENVHEGSRLENIIEKLIHCDILIVIVTPAVLNSRAVAEEIKIAKEKNMKIIPCKDKYVQKTWTELPWDLVEYKGFEFENPDELKRKSYAALVKNLEELSKELQDSIPKKTETKKSIITEREAIEIEPTNGDLTWEKYTIKGKKKDHKIMGTVQNGAIEKIMIERKSLSLLIDVKMLNDGFLRIINRRDLIDSKKKNNHDSPFIILVDWEEVPYAELSTSIKQRALQINLSKHSKNIQIIGTEIEGISYLGEAKKENEVRILQGSAAPHDGQYLEPEILTIKIGDTVKWINDDSSAHKVTSGDPAMPETVQILFDSGLMMSKSTFTVTFNEVGINPYFDMIHPWIQGTIVVE